MIQLLYNIKSLLTCFYLYQDKKEEALFWKFIRDSTAKSGQTVVETLKEQVPRFKMEHPELATSRRALRLITSSKETQRSHN